MGIGHIADVMTIGESVMYTVDFGAKGKKAMDAAYAKLKKFLGAICYSCIFLLT